MAYPYKKENVNSVNTRTWVTLNDGCQSSAHRNQFCKQYGGEFIKNGAYFKWEELERVPERRILIFEREGEVFEVENVLEFCRNHQLTKSALYEVVSGKRKHHKNFRFVTKK
ncbi:MAG TPA: hypothetical protein DCF87_09395 [Opitutae bacterium]|nr:hypothetical protein [Opitutae bacterium]|tara:strand:+ start:2646 stop:2981 length:336 start_codon:yes stop_codon:yes gene_type:complete